MSEKAHFVEIVKGIQEKHIEEIPLYEQIPSFSSRRSAYRIYKDGSLYSIVLNNFKGGEWKFLYKIDNQGMVLIKDSIKELCKSEQKSPNKVIEDMISLNVAFEDCSKNIKIHENVQMKLHDQIEYAMENYFILSDQEE